MLVLRATTTWAGAFLEASSRGNAHDTLTNPTATNTVSFPGEPAWLLHCPPPPLPFTLVGEWGGGGRFPHPDTFVSWHLDCWGVEAWQARILILYECEIMIYARVGNGLRVHMIGEYEQSQKFQKNVAVRSSLPTVLFPRSTSLTWRRNIRRHYPQQDGFWVCSSSPDLRYY